MESGGVGLSMARATGPRAAWTRPSAGPRRCDRAYQLLPARHEDASGDHRRTLEWRRCAEPLLLHRPFSCRASSAAAAALAAASAAAAFAIASALAAAATSAAASRIAMTAALEAVPSSTAPGSKEGGWARDETVAWGGVVGGLSQPPVHMWRVLIQRA